MNVGFLRILDKLKETPLNTILRDRFISLIDEQPDSQERHMWLLQLAEIYQTSSPAEALSWSHRVYSEDRTSSEALGIMEFCLRQLGHADKAIQVAQERQRLGHVLQDTENTVLAPHMTTLRTEERTEERTEDPDKTVLAAPNYVPISSQPPPPPSEETPLLPPPVREALTTLSRCLAFACKDLSHPDVFPAWRVVMQHLYEASVSRQPTQVSYGDGCFGRLASGIQSVGLERTHPLWWGFYLDCLMAEGLMFQAFQQIAWCLKHVPQNATFAQESFPRLPLILTRLGLKHITWKPSEGIQALGDRLWPGELLCVRPM